MSTQTTLAAVIDDPFQILPQVCRMEVSRMWAVYRYLIPEPMNLAAPISAWINTHGVNPAKLAKICKDMTTPEAMSEIKYASQFMNILAQNVSALRESTGFGDTYQFTQKGNS